jgi:hypothetical protein
MLRGWPLDAWTPEEPGARQLRLGWADWLRTFKWDWWVTPTFRRAVTGAGAGELVRGWLGQQRADAYAVMAVERGAVNDRTHAHVLLGGVGAHPQLRLRLERAWYYGHILVQPYAPRLDPPGTRTGACYYLVKDPEAVEVLGRLRRWRPR